MSTLLPSVAESSVASGAVNGSQHPDVPRGNSRVLYVPVNPGEFHPTGPGECPFGKSLSMDQARSEELAVALNRDRLQDVQFGKRNSVGSWHVIVALACRQTHVVRVPVPEDWIPESEFDLPPLALSGLVTHKEARGIVNAVNTAELNRQNIRRWAIHIKLPGTSLANRDSFDREAWDCLRNVLRATGERVRIFSKGGGELLVMTSELCFHSDFCKNGEGARLLREYAGQLLQAAAKLDGEERPTFTRMQPSGIDFALDGADEEIHISVWNESDPVKAQERVENFISLMRS
ncbi:hypothetical protein [Thalassoglobus neptunius]|nr:hypothetical protein [Thalassoglobus neptunius]